MTSRRRFLSRGLLAVACACAAPGLGFSQAPPVPPVPPGTKFVCPPCGCGSDAKEYDAPGQCTECGMVLIVKAAEPKPAPGGAMARNAPEPAPKVGASGPASAGAS